MSIASGEWWIDDYGNAQFADGDVGDQSHEGMALQAILAEYGIDVEDPKTPELWPGHIRDDQTRWLVRHGMPRKMARTLQEAADVRELMIEHRGWIRLAGVNAELWQFDADTLNKLRSGIWEAWGGDGWDAMDPEELDFEVGIEEAKTRRTFEVPFNALMDDRMDAESLMRLGAEGEIVQAPTAPALRAAWARKAARERGVEENPVITNYGVWVDDRGIVLGLQDEEHHTDAVFRTYRKRLPKIARKTFMRVLSDHPPTEQEWAKAGLPASDYETFIAPEDYNETLGQWAIEHGWTRVTAFTIEREIVMGLQSESPITDKALKAAWKTWREIDDGNLDPNVAVMLDVGGKALVTDLGTIEHMDAHQTNTLIFQHGKRHEGDELPTSDKREQYMAAAWARKAARERGVEENPAKRRYLDPELAVAKRFGTTDSPKTAFYILSDGTFVDSGRQPRKTDHREIMRAFMDDDFNMLVKVPSTVIKTYREKSQWELVRWFMMKTGAIRAHPETGGLYLCKPPTSAQYRAIREWSDWFSPQAASISGTGVIVEYDPTCGDCGEGHFTKEFHAGEATERIVSVIELMIDGLTRKKNPAGTSMEDQWKSYIQKAVGKNRVKFDNNYTVFRDDEGKPTGTVELYFEYPKGTRPATVYLSLIAVVPERRRRGHGTTMLSLLTQFADNQGWRIAGFAQAWGGVNLGQGYLVRWYKKFGFKIDTEGGMIREPKARKTP